jgi:hypothetical protein
LDCVGHLFRGGLVGLAGPEQELEQDRAFELFEGVGDLVARASRRLPLGDDALRMGHSDPERGRADLALPDDVARFHNSPFATCCRVAATVIERPAYFGGRP